jgi:capsular exopolysaccharide synthesis family protein
MNKRVNLENQVSEAVEEALRTLRTNIQFCAAEKPIKTICLTSCIPNEGKSMTALNLAISMASANKTVMYIDADMRKPRQCKMIDASFNTGLSNYLSGMSEVEEIISETNINNLQLILSGPKPPNPAELIGTSRFTALLEKLKETYNYVIVDTPPLGSMIDAALVATVADGTIMLIEHNTIDYNKALKVKEQLEKANARILGVVLNKIPRKEFRDYYYYDYSYHYRQHSGEKDLVNG